MNCSQFEQLFHDLDRPGTEGYAERESALEHAESCSRCAQLLTRAESLDLALSAMSAREVGERAPAHVETLLREEFRSLQAASTRRKARWQVAALATAAVLLLALGITIRHHEQVTARNGSHSTPSLTSGAVPSATDATAEDSDSNATELAMAESQVADSGSASGFVALPFADDSVSTDGGAIVRVVLSRPELASLGLPVTDMADTDRVAADIVVSEDGAPQAIRLVSRPALD